MACRSIHILLLVCVAIFGVLAPSADAFCIFFCPPAPAPAPAPSSCSSNFLDPAQNVKSDGITYKYKKVDWKGFMDAIDCLGQREFRTCAFIIRMFFHDEAIDTSKRPISGADASVILDQLETIIPPSTQHGEAVMDRYILGKLAEKFGMSYADGLSVAAAQCTLTLGSSLNIPKTCSRAGIPLKVGKMDMPNINIGVVNGLLPDGFDTADKWLKFWRDFLNSNIKSAKWKFGVDEAVALMGSHVMLDNHGCTLSSSGKLRKKTWENSYFLDLLSGSVKVVDESNTPYIIGFNAFTRDVVNGCDFETSGFERKTQNAEYEVEVAQKRAGISLDNDNPDELDVRWRPDNNRAFCGGADQCKPCGLFDLRKFCKFRLLGDAFWPYTVNDGFLSLAARASSTFPYCNTAPFGCPTSYSKLQKDLLAIPGAFNKFRASNDKWLKAYATGHCKLSNTAANYVDGKGTDLTDLIGSYTGQCSGDPGIQAVVNDILGDPPCDVEDPFPDQPDPNCGLLNLFCLLNPPKP